MGNTKKQESTIVNWLKNKEQMMCVVELYKSKYGFIKIPLTEGYDILYVCKRMNGEHLSLHEELEYQGFYEKDSGLLYDVQYELRLFISEDLYEGQSSYNLKSNFECDVRELVETMVGEFENTIKLDDSTEKIQNDCKYSAKYQARSIYLCGGDTDLTYQCPYEANYFSYEMFDYVKDKGKFVKETAKKYCEDHRDEIVRSIVLNLMTKAILETLQKDNDKHLLAMRDIIASIPPECRMVKVTTVIDGKEFTFKYEANTLREDCRSHYYMSHMGCRDREEFENIYGRHTNFGPEDISMITYGRKVIYEKE